jgi:hypothetical protein
MIKIFLQLLLLYVGVCYPLLSFSQAPTQFNFQGVARNKEGNTIASKTIALRFTIRTGSPSGFVSYQERRSTLTDSSGVFNAIIGGDGAITTDGKLDTVIWTTGPKFLAVEIDTANGTNFVNLGATQMLSVPFALLSNHSISSGNYFFEAIFISSPTFLNSGTLNFPRTSYNDLSPITNKPVYDSTTGVFTAPVAGIYQFDIWVHGKPTSDEDESIIDELYLTKNGTRIRVVMSQDDQKNSDVYFQLNCTLSLRANDAIEVRYVGTGVVAGQSTFSGYKIY